MPLTYCFAGSDIKARWHVAFPERSAAPSRLPVHLHNVATCHMETGSTNLCLPPSRRLPLSSSFTSQFGLFSPSLSLHSSPVVLYFLGCSSCLGFIYLFFLAKTRQSSILFVLTRKKLSLWGAGETRFNTHIHRASRVLRGVRGPHVNTSCEDGGDREKG